jgi:hypothetical protein
MKLFKSLLKWAISIGSVFLWMYLFNIGLGLANASDDMLVALGAFIAAVVTIVAIMGNVLLWTSLWKKESKSL